jgi:two-component system, response regulator PdtaR
LRPHRTGSEASGGESYALLLSSQQASEGGGAGRAARGGLRVFILEDEMFVALDLEATVQALGHKVCGTASSADEALQLGAAAEPDLILADINLGSEIDGIEAVQHILAEHDSRIIFVTAYHDEATRLRAAEAVPGSRLIGKPLSEPQLAAAIKQLFDGN